MPVAARAGPAVSEGLPLTGIGTSADALPVDVLPVLTEFVCASLAGVVVATVDVGGTAGDCLAIVSGAGGWI